MPATPDWRRSQNAREVRAWTAPPFVNRVGELELLETQVDAVLAGKPRIVLIEGEPGIGKTRVLSELRRIARGRGLLDLHGRAQGGLELPYSLFWASLFPALEAFLRETNSPEAGPFARFLHGSADQGDVASAPDLAAESKTSVYAAVSRGVIELARTFSPALLSFDDLQWADAGSLQLLEFLTFSMADAGVKGRLPLLVVAAFWPPPPQSNLAQLVGRLRREEVCYWVNLAGFGEIEVGELVQALGVDRPSHQLTDSIAETARGNPLIVQGVVSQLLSSDAIRTRGGYATSSIAPSALGLPADTTSAALLKLEGLTPEVSRVLTLASFLTGSFTTQVLEAVGPNIRQRMGEALQEGMRRGILSRVGGRYEFEQALHRAALQNEASQADREATHARIASALERLWPDPDTEQVMAIAHHLVAAGTHAAPKKVFDLCRAAGSRAMEIFAWSQAAPMFEAAIGAAGGNAIGNEDDLAELYFLAGLAHHRNEDWALSLERYGEAAERFKQAGNLRGEQFAMRGLVNVQAVSGEPLSGVETAPLHELLARLPETDPESRGQLSVHIANAAYSSGRYDEALDSASRARAVGEQIGDADICMKACMTAASVEFQQLRLADSLASWDKARGYARECGDDWVKGLPLVRIPQTLITVGRLTDAEEAATSGLNLSRAVRDWGDCSMALGYLISIAALRGDFNDAERLATEAMMMMIRSGYKWSQRVVLPALAFARYQRGAWQEALDALTHGTVAGGSALRRLIELRASAPEAGNSADLSTRRRADASPDAFALSASCASIEIADLLRDPAAAEAQLPVLLPAIGQGAVFAPGWPSLLRRSAGIAQALNQRWDEAEASFNAALVAAETSGARTELGRCYLDYGRLLLDQGVDMGRGLELVRTAREILSDLGMAAFAQQANDLIDAATPRPAGGPGEPAQANDAALTASEQAVLVLAARDRRPEEIAEALLLSLDTVAGILNVIEQKTGTAEPRAALKNALEHGLVDESLVLGTQPEGTPAADKPDAFDAGTQRATRIILMTDIVNSVGLTEEMGDADFRRVARALDADLRLVIREQDGLAIEGILFGDGIMALFTSAGQAIHCAFSCRRAAQGRGVQLHLGLHAGDVLFQDGNAYGGAVNMAKRVCDSCEPGEVMVSDTVRGLARTSVDDVTFQDRGEHLLKGIGEAQRLFAAGEAGKGKAEAQTSRPSGTVTILFTDVVDSTPISERMGDAAFRAVSRDLDSAVRAAIRANGGSVVEGKVLGDGVMATFGSAGRAIQAALACKASASKTQLTLHIGLHAGDVIDEGSNVYGWAVNMASRVCGASSPGEILVSETVRVLARGSSDLIFEDRGLHELKGIEEPQRLFAVEPGGRANRATP